jgi:DNA modification methylase
MERTLKDIFVVPPISVLDVKQGYWKTRRKYWLESGIESELGRNENLLSLSTLLKKKQKSTSIFDPVLCEIMYKWFSESGDLVFDPFCGGSVRGIVASKCERDYIGIDIREEQLDANRIQTKSICDTYLPTYYHIDGKEMREYDFFFTCPPYFNLEKYSNREDDLSNMTEEMFWIEYEKIIEQSLSYLKDNRFAAIVVGDVRRKDGSYLLLPHRTIDIFQKYGLTFYNDLVLLQEPATAAMRAFNYMNSSRKIAKAHQNVLVFVKGDVTIASSRLSKFSDDSIEENSIEKWC